MRKKEILQLPVLLLLLLLMSGPAFAAAFNYDFNNLAGNDAQPFANLNGQDGWTSQGFSSCGGFTNPNNYIMGLTAISGFDGTEALRFEEVGCGYGADASHKRTASFAVPFITGTTKKIVLQGDFHVGAWANVLRFAYDANSDGIIRKSDATEIGPGLNIGNVPGVQLIPAVGAAVSVTLASLGIQAGDWVRLRLEIDPVKGTGSVYYQDLTRGDVSLQAIPALQDINMSLDWNSAGVARPALWDSVYIHLEGAGNQFDNLFLDSKDATIAYIYSADTASRDSFSSLLSANGFFVETLSLAEAETHNFIFDSAIIIGNDTGNAGTWSGSAIALNNIYNAGKPVVGIGAGGAYFFQQVGGLFINWGQSMGESLTGVKVVDPASTAWSSPGTVANGGAESPVTLYNAAVSTFEMYNPAPEAGVTRVGRSGNAGNPDHYPLIFELEAGKCYESWGFTGSPDNMTAEGKQLFVNVISNPCRSLVSEWKGEGDATDSVGNNDGAMNGATFAQGLRGQAFNFNGSSNISLPDAIIPSTSRNFSVSAWVNPTDTNVPAGTDRIIFYGGANSGEYTLTYKEAAGYQFGVKLTDGNWYFVGTFTPTAGAWSQLVGIRDGTQIELWVDGVRQAAAAIPDLERYVTGGYGTRIGSVSFDTAYWKGLIDEVQVYNRALFAEEVTNMYNLIQPSALAISQYADIAADYSSQYSAVSWSAMQAVGEPDTNSYGDNSTAWAPSSKNGTEEYLMLEFASPVYASGATIRETYGNGFVTQIDAVDLNNVLHTVWSGADPSLTGNPVDFEVSWALTNYLVKGLKIYVNTSLDQDAWEEIDSVQLHGVPVAEITPPTGSVIINSANAYLNSFDAALDLTCSDAEGSCAEMRFSNDYANWSAPEAFATTKAWTLAAGEGAKTVYVKFKDNSGNWSEAYSDTITLDTILPTGLIRINSDAAYTSSAIVYLKLSASDTNDLEMMFSNDNTNWSEFEPYATTKTWTLSAGDGTKTVYVKFRDSADNVSSLYSDTIKLASDHAIQYASSVISYSSQYDSGSWSAAQTLGEPNTFGYGDISTSWTSSSSNGTQEYLTLGFSTPVYADGAVIRETYGNGFVTKIDVLDTDDALHTVWTGSDTSAPGSPVNFEVSWTQTAYLVKGIKIYVDTNHSGSWEEMDSVQLKGFAGAGVTLASSIVSLWKGGEGEIICDESYNCTITPDNGYHIMDVLVDGESAGRLTSYQFDDDGSSHTLEVIFAEGSFSLLSNKLITGRGGHTQTRLNNGRVLIAGGFIDDESETYVSTDKAEIYDPVTKTFALTGSMKTPRVSHTATLLTNGKVLIAGGSACPGLCNPYLSTLEVYDPAAGTFSLVTDNMSSARTGHTATLLPDGRVLLAGGISGWAGDNIYLNDADIYDPSNNSLTHLVNALNGNRSDHTATLLKNGKVLIAAGRNAFGTLGSAKLFDPSDDTFTDIGNMKNLRAYHDSVLMENGNVLLMGGYFDGAIITAEVFDPFDNSFINTSNNMQDSRRSPSSVLLANGKVLVVGGSDGSGNIGLSRSFADIYDPDTDEFIDAGKMAVARVAPATLLPDGSVLVAGGFPDGWGNPVLDTAEIYNGYDLFSLTVNSPANGTVSCGPAKVVRGSSSECLINADTGYYLSSLTDNGISVIGAVSGNTYSMSNITASHNINAVFSAISVNGVCGTSNGQTLTTTPVLSLCNTGTPSAVTGTGPWNWSCTGSNGGANANCSASIQTYSLTLNMSGTGSVTGSGTYNHGQTVTVNAIADSSSTFSGWSGDCSGANNSTAILMTGIKTCTAAFTLKTYTVTTGAGPNGKISCAPISVNYGSSSTCTITPDAEYQVEEVRLDGVSVGNAGSYAMSDITSDCTVTASFAIKRYNLSITKTGSGTVAFSPPGRSCGTDCFTYNKNQRVTVSAKAEKDHIFTGWTGGCSGKGICRMSMGADANVDANFVAAAPVISVTPDGPQDFGNVRVGRLKTKTLKVTNNGTGNLRITSVEIDGEDNKMFSKRSGTKIIKPGKSATLRVMFKPKSTGLKTATLVINSNDPNLSVIEMQLSGTGKTR